MLRILLQIKEKIVIKCIDKLISLNKLIFSLLSVQIKRSFNRHVSVGDLIFDRWETAQNYGFGVGSSCYDNVLILGDVKVGKNTWIGPNVVLDGSGGLVVGDFVSISAGAQIYSHNSIRKSMSLGKEDTQKSATKIGNGVYIGPNAVIQMGVTIGDHAVIGAMTLVLNDVPPNSKFYGIPGKLIN